MNHLIVAVFDTEDAARKALQQLRTLEREGVLELEDTAVVVRDRDGKTHVKGEVSGTTETGAVAGAVIGAMLWFLFPVVGILVGAALGAAVGSLMDTGVDEDFIADVKRTLEPGKSALFVVIRKASMDAVVGALEPFRGELLQTTLDPDAEMQLREALR
jgi:uncharacterized membrane protein